MAEHLSASLLRGFKSAAAFERSLSGASCLSSKRPSGVETRSRSSYSSFPHFALASKREAASQAEVASLREEGQQQSFPPPFGLLVLFDSSEHHNIRIDFTLRCFQVPRALSASLKAPKTEPGIDVTITEKASVLFAFPSLSRPVLPAFVFPPRCDFPFVCQTFAISPRRQSRAPPLLRSSPSLRARSCIHVWPSPSELAPPHGPLKASILAPSLCRSLLAFIYSESQQQKRIKGIYRA